MSFVDDNVLNIISLILFRIFYTFIVAFGEDGSCFFQGGMHGELFEVLV